MYEKKLGNGSMIKTGPQVTKKYGNYFSTRVYRLPFCPLCGKLRSSQNSEFSETEGNFGETQVFLQENLGKCFELSSQALM